MKRHTLTLALAALLLAGCNHDKEFSTRTISATQCYLLAYDEQMGPWGDTLGLKKVLEVEWPAKGFLSADAERELMKLCFDDSTSTNADKAAPLFDASSLNKYKHIPVMIPESAAENTSIIFLSSRVNFLTEITPVSRLSSRFARDNFLK